MMPSSFIQQMSLQREELDYQLSPSLWAKDASGCLNAYQSATASAKRSTKHHFLGDIPYGDRPETCIDLYVPFAQRRQKVPCFVFLHGGFWQEGSKDGAAFAAEAFTQHGCAFAAVGYSLTPTVCLTDIVTQIDAAIHFLYQNADKWGIDPGGLVIGGHSAGAHLAACMIIDVMHSGVSKCLAGALLISGVYDLVPIAQSYVNDLARLTPNEIEALSPVRYARPSHLPIMSLVGADEPPAFQVHSDALAAAWTSGRGDFSFQRVDGKDHFDILQCLSEPNGPVFQQLQRLMNRT